MNRRRPRTDRALGGALVLAFLCGCGRGDASASLPPATGARAAPLPTLPHVGATKDANANPSAGRTTGTTFARRETELGPSVTGTLESVFVTEGQTVAKGEVVFRLDARDAELRVAQARAALEAAEVNLRAVSVERERTRQLVDEQAANRAQWDQISARFDGAKVGVDQAKIAVAMAEKGLADMVVRAPFAGVVTAKRASEGQTVTLMPPTTVIVLQEQATLDLRLRLPESALRNVKVGTFVRANFAAIGVERDAKISRMVPVVDPRTRTFEAIAEIPNADRALQPGLLAEVSVGDFEKLHEEAEIAP